MTAKRLAVIVAALGLVAGLFGPFRVVRVFVANSGRGPGILGLWMIIPISAGILATLATRTDSVGFVWATVGAAWGFVVLAAWSFGSFFGWEAVLLLGAAIVHAVTVRPRWKLLVVPVWFVAGASALSFVLLAVHGILQMRSAGSTVTHAPAVLFGGWLCAAALTLLGAAYATPMVWRGRCSRGRLKTVALTGLILALTLIALALATQGVRALAR